MVHQRRLDHGEDDEHIHRTMRRKSGGADPFGQAHAAVDLHGPRVAALHLGQELGRLLLLDQRAAHALLAQGDSERQPGRTGTDDENLGVHGGLILPTGSITSLLSRFRERFRHL